MDPIVNLEETPGKFVGKLPRGTPFERYERMVKQFERLGLKLPYPKGVFRFKTFEEADAWAWKHMIEAAKEKFRARQTPPT